MGAIRGCDEDLKHSYNEFGIDLVACPHRMIAEDSQDEIRVVVEAWRAFRDHGLPPCSGGSLEQPAAIMDAIGVCESEASAWEAENRESAMNEARRR